MGLDVSHDCWHGAYSAFSRFRSAIAKAAKIPLGLMEGFYESPFDDYNVKDLTPSSVHWWLPLSWDKYNSDPLCILLNHSDCGGEIAASDCAPLAARLRQIAPLLSGQNGGGHLGDIEAKAIQFAEGLELAHSKGEEVRFR